MKARTARRIRGWSRTGAPVGTSCAGKIRHASAGEARAAQFHPGRPGRRAEGRSKSLNIYQCAHCGGWHLGHAFFTEAS